MRIFSLLVFILLLSATQPIFAQEEKEEDKDASTEKTSFVEKINFEEGTFLGNVNDKFMKFVGGVEKWRLEKKEKIETSLDKIETRREDEKDPKPAVKVITILHIGFLAVLLFLFSLQFVFWTVSILLVIAIIRRLVRFIVGLVRRDHIRA